MVDALVLQEVGQLPDTGLGVAEDQDGPWLTRQVGEHVTQHRVDLKQKVDQKIFTRNKKGVYAHFPSLLGILITVNFIL